MAGLSGGLAAIRRGGKPALARALAAVERAGLDDAAAALLDEAFAAPSAPVVGLTGPPGVGKSTLAGALLRRRRAAHRTVGLLAVDPSSRLSGGALLGDRARLQLDPADPGVFMRSLAARDRLGGLSELAVRAVVLLRACFDELLLESVGVGQSEADIAVASDTVVLCVQPGAGDALQFMKAGIMEVPDVVAVTKADAGPAATRACAEVAGALSLAAPRRDGWHPLVVAVSAATGAGLDDLDQAVAAHRAAPGGAARRAGQGEAWLLDAVRAECGRRGVAALPDGTRKRARTAPFAAISEALRGCG